MLGVRLGVGVWDGMRYAMGDIYVCMSRLLLMCEQIKDKIRKGGFKWRLPYLISDIQRGDGKALSEHILVRYKDSYSVSCHHTISCHCSPFIQFHSLIRMHPIWQPRQRIYGIPT
jgi:hypothetical protein